MNARLIRPALRVSSRISSTVPGVCLALCAGLFGMLVLNGCSTPHQMTSFPEPADLPAQANMPDPLTSFNGQHINSPQQWFKERRPELATLFQHYMYGSLSPAPAHVQATVDAQYPDFLGAKATLKIVTVRTGEGNAPRIQLMLVVPNQRAGRVPTFLAMNFCGNHALTGDPRVPLSQTWMPDFCKGCSNNTPSEASRGSQADDWPLEEMVRRGYALAAFYSGDIDPDRKDVSQGIYAWLANGDPTKNKPEDRGTIAAWAWGFQRCVDYLLSDPDIDPHRIAAVGHSRNGKAALVAAAFDQRIAIAYPHQAGCGGSAPSRGKTGESVKSINEHFPHWFNAQFKQFNDAPERLPFDQNCLVAMCAPRPVLFSAAQEDQWANPAGQFQVLQAADPVYRLLGVEGLGATQMPPLRQLVSSRLGYYIREGKHSMTADDWRVFMDFADRQYGRK